MKFKLPYSVVIAAAALLVSAMPIASAQGINFSGITAGQTFTTYLQPNSDWIVTNSTTQPFWENKSQGNLPPALSNNATVYPGKTTQTIAVTDQVGQSTSGALLPFTFTSVDLGLSDTASNQLTYTITGYDGPTSGTPVFTAMGNDKNCCTTGIDWTTLSDTGLTSTNMTTQKQALTFLPNSDPGGVITQLVITVKDTTSNAGDYLDNIDVSSVPEGGAGLMYLLLGGGACFGAMFLTSRRRLAVFAAA
jgi:hypothetical protein